MLVDRDAARACSMGDMGWRCVKPQRRSPVVLVAVHLLDNDLHFLDSYLWICALG
jgi:hypothetical protein